MNHSEGNISDTYMKETIVLDLTREECFCIHRLCEIAQVYNDEHVYFKNSAKLIAQVDERMNPAYNCIYCGNNACDCHCKPNPNQMNLRTIEP